MNDSILSAGEMRELAKTERGQRILFSYIVSARIAYAMQHVFEMLDVVPEAGMQQKCCQTIHDTLFRVPQEQIFLWCAEVANWDTEERHEGAEC